MTGGILVGLLKYQAIINILRRQDSPVLASYLHLRAVVALVGERQDARARAAWDPVALQQRVAQWTAEYGGNAAAATAAVESLIRAVATLATMHPPYVRAAANRSGQYGDLVDVYELLRQGMALELRRRIKTLSLMLAAPCGLRHPYSERSFVASSESLSSTFRFWATTDSP